MSVRIIEGDVRERLRDLPDESVHCVVTSPPYFGLRDYGVAGQIGLEPTPDEFVAALVGVFREVRRVLRADGTLWLNLGDSYCTVPHGPKGANAADPKNPDARLRNGDAANRRALSGIKHKDLIGIPWRVAFALQADGWFLRQDIIWSKPNPMPESVTDRCTKAHEYLFLLSKSARYHYDQDAILEPVEASTIERLSQPTIDQQRGSDRVPGKSNGPMKAVSRSGNKERKPASARGVPVDTDGKSAGAVAGSVPWEGSQRNKRSVWTVATQPFSEAHFATFPPALIEPCILAGCPKDCCAKCGAPIVRATARVDQGFDGSRYGERAVAASGGAITGGTAKSTLGSSNGKLVGRSETTGWEPSCSCAEGTTRGTVLDPFGGAGTTGLVADRLQRDAILIELNPEYAAMARRRIYGDAPLLTEVA